MAKDGQVCFHRRLFADPVNQRCTTGPVRPLDGINKDVGGAKLLLTTTSVYPVDCACICPLTLAEESQSGFNTSNWYFSNYQMCDLEQFL